MVCKIGYSWYRWFRKIGYEDLASGLMVVFGPIFQAMKTDINSNNVVLQHNMDNICNAIGYCNRSKHLKRAQSHSKNHSLSFR